MGGKGEGGGGGVGFWVGWSGGVVNRMFFDVLK